MNQKKEEKEIIVSQIPKDTGSIIFYGAGENAERNFSKWISEGLTPICFADADPNKHYSKLCGIEILPLAEAISRYPDYMLYITTLPGSLLKIRNYLIENGIPAERIKVAESYEYRKGCFRLGKHLEWAGDKNLVDMNFMGCCLHDWGMKEYTTMFKTTGDAANDFQIYKEFCDNTINNWRNEKVTRCDGCPSLKHGYYEIEPKLNVITITTARGDYCNFRCSYCFLRDWNETFLENVKKEEHAKRHDFTMSILRYIRDNHITDPGFVLQYGAGEPTVSPYFEEIVEFWHKNKMNVILSSNWSVYKQCFADFSRDCGARLHTSLDAGTAETFARIKGVDCFDKVVNNLIRFSDNGGLTVLKYIILEGVNDNEEDITGFLDIAKRIKLKLIKFNNTLRGRNETMSSKLLEMSCFFLKECHARGLGAPQFEEQYLHPIDKEKLDECVRELWRGQ